jgi:hypothetical protein
VLEKAFGLSEKAVEHIKAKFAAWKPRFDNHVMMYIRSTWIQ